jgi:hypothetical protein
MDFFMSIGESRQFLNRPLTLDFCRQGFYSNYIETQLIMSYNAKVQFSYVNDSESTPSKYFPEIVDKHTITIEAPAQDLNVHQYYDLFRGFLRAVGFAEYSIMDGACRLAFSDSNEKMHLDKLMEEYELQDKQTYDDGDCRALEDEVRDLKAKLSLLEQPDNPQYTDEEMDALCAENEVTLGTLKNADVVCKDCGSKYGHYSVSCSSTWMGTCNVCGQELPVTEVRDWNYLKEGINKLSK